MIDRIVAEGQYWAKHIKCDGSVEGFIPSDEWEVVMVYENAICGPTDFRVFVQGMDESQPLDNFIWGPGPLEEPSA